MKLAIASLLGSLLMVIVALTPTGLGDVGSSQTVNTSSETLNSTMLKEIVLGSSVQPQTYLFTLEMSQKTVIINGSQSNESNATKESQEISTKSFGVGALNLTARAMKMVMATLAAEKGQEENGSAISVEMYLLNDTMYMKIDGNWTKTKFSEMSLKDIWKQQDKIGQQRDSINASNITLLGTEKVNGIECFKVKAIPDMKSYVTLEKEQLGSMEALPSLNISNLLNDTAISYISWISKDKHILLKTEIATNMTFDPESLGLPVKKPGELRMDIETSYNMLFSGFDKNINIVIPSDSKKAVALPGLLDNSTKEVASPKKA